MGGEGRGEGGGGDDEMKGRSVLGNDTLTLRLLVCERHVELGSVTQDALPFGGVTSIAGVESACLI